MKKLLTLVALLALPNYVLAQCDIKIHFKNSSNSPVIVGIKSTSGGLLMLPKYVSNHGGTAFLQFPDKPGYPYRLAVVNPSSPKKAILDVHGNPLELALSCAPDKPGYRNVTLDDINGQFSLN